MLFEHLLLLFSYSTAAVNEDLSEQVMFMKSHHEPHENTLE